MHLAEFRVEPAIKLTSSNSTTGCGLFTSRNTAAWSSSHPAIVRLGLAPPHRNQPDDLCRDHGAAAEEQRD